MASWWGWPAAAPRPRSRPSSAADRVVLRQRLVAALDRVTQVQREVVLLHDLENWTHAEIAAALEMSEVMSRQHLFVARTKLREALAETGTAGGESDHG
jgi:RNA polymerase sigma factor (sigma-70 family)